MNILSLVATAESTSASTGGRAQYELRVGAFMKRELEVVSFQGHEKLNQPYAYDVAFASSVPVEVLQTGMFGFPACLSIQAPKHEPRVIQGLAISFESLGAAESELRTKTRRYTTRIVPRLWLLNHTRKYRVFQDQSAVQIACAVLESAGIAATLRLKQDEYPSIPFMYQRGETDLEFLHHVLAVAGIFYYFEHASGLLDQLVPGAGELGALAGGLGGVASAAGSFSVGAGGSGLSPGLGAGAGFGGGSLDGATSAVGAVASAVGAATTLILCDRSRHTSVIEDTSSPLGIGAASTAGLNGALGSLGGTLGSIAGVVADAAGMLAGALADALPYDGQGQAAAAVERIFSFRSRAEVRPKSVTLRDWSLAEGKGLTMVEESAAVSLDLSAGIAAAADLIAGGGSNLAGAVDLLNVDALPIATKDASVMEYQRDAALLSGNDPFAERALSQLRSDRVAAYGRSDCRRLAPGYRFKLARHPIAPVNTEYLVTELSSTGYAPDHLPHDCPYLYQNDFSCVPASVDPRPPKPPPRPQLGLEPATVVGPQYGDVHCDSVGRILVRFHWADPTRTYSETDPAVCRVYWLERWAGNGFGTLTLPRVGTEVLVDFPNHDGGTPVAIGQVYSRVNAPPFALPRDASTVGIRSDVIGAPGYSELAMDDRTGDVRLRAQRSRETDVLADDHLRIQRDRRVDVGGNADDRTAGHRVNTVGGDATSHIDGSQTTRIGGDSTATIGGSLSVTAKGGIHAALGHLAPHLTGPLDLHVEGETRFTHQRSLVTDVARDETTTIAGSKVLTAGDFDASFVGPCSLVSSDLLTFRSAKGIRLCCGASELHLTPHGISLVGDTLEITAAKQLELAGAGPSLTLDRGFTVMSKTVTIQSTGARLELSDSAKLAGSKVQLGQGTGATSQLTSTSASTQNVSLRLIDPAGQPLAHATYQATVADRMTQGTTDGSGNVSLAVPQDATSLRLVVWTSQFPEGPRVTYVVDIAPMGDPSALDGAQMRLRNLGFYRGPITGRMDVATQDALLVFQRHRRLPLTGRLDDATSSQLADAHD